MKKTGTLLLGSVLLASCMTFAQTTQRIPLYETFTSSTCPPCNPGNVHLEGLFNEPENEGKFTSLKYQMSWPGSGDPYYTVEGGARRGNYSVTSVPRLELDGGFDAGPTSLTQAMMDEAYAEPAIVELDAYYQVNEATKTVTVQISAKALQELSGTGGLFLHCAIFEKVTYQNVKTNGETKFEHVMKKMLPSASGTYLGSMDAGETESVDLSYTFNGDYTLPPNATEPIDHTTEHSIEEFSDLGVVVWVQRNSTREVYQSAYAKAGTAGLFDNENSGIEMLSVYPNPTNSMATITFQTAEQVNNATVTVMDNTGKIVFEQPMTNLSAAVNLIEVDTEDLENGVYFVVLATDEGRLTKKLSVIH